MQLASMSPVALELAITFKKLETTTDLPRPVILQPHLTSRQTSIGCHAQSHANIRETSSIRIAMTVLVLGVVGKPRSCLLEPDMLTFPFFLLSCLQALDIIAWSSVGSLSSLFELHPHSAPGNAQGHNPLAQGYYTNPFVSGHVQALRTSYSALARTAAKGQRLEGGRKLKAQSQR